jgi:hypothetical protein
MRRLNGLYTQRFNRRHERVGHIFQGRFTQPRDGCRIGPSRRSSAHGPTTASSWARARVRRLPGADYAARCSARRSSPRASGRARFPGREPLEELFRPQGGLRRADRNERIRKAIRTHGYTASEIGRHLGLHYSTIGKIIATRNSRSTLAHQRQPRPSCSALPSGDASNSQFQT